MQIFLIILLFLTFAGVAFAIIHFATSKPLPKSSPPPPAMTEPGKSRVEEAPTCVWCGKNEYDLNNQEYQCPECGITHHTSCWAEYGGCSTWDCSLSPAYKKNAD